jgi:hypothetical protein
MTGALNAANKQVGFEVAVFVGLWVGVVGLMY